ncbi:hypothetical protein E6O75_ATG04618 [Venturia nashicola]|uniref:Histone transcription regulator 3 homolog n=1 Tax=Venturia nashicola TaxID=86259 RepID=A0A4Z1P8G4_9PEZI|nr:hypothetical protein E6O75_ATG04618 [Venturia nashicola]
MSAFVALNIEYDNVSEPEVDDTKELQIEDALKLYQTALKFHSEGPRSYEHAQEAYAALFQSEIFKYPESQSELKRFESVPEYEELWNDGLGLDAGPVQLAVPTDNAPNTLPQIIHLSYKNHGQFLLDLLQHRIREHLRENPDVPLVPKQIGDTAREPLSYYSEALDKDDTDVDLWRCTSAVATVVGSNRIARFCLEAVLDMGEDSDQLGLSGIEQTIALQRLQEFCRSLQDDLSLLVGPLSTFRRKKLGEALRKRLETHPSIPKPSFESTAYSEVGNKGRAPMRYMFTAPGRNWAAVGEAILQQLNLMELGQVDTGPGAGLSIVLPDPAPDETQQVLLPTEPTPPSFALPEVGNTKAASPALASPAAVSNNVLVAEESMESSKPTGDVQMEDATEEELESSVENAVSEEKTAGPASEGEAQVSADVSNANREEAETTVHENETVATVHGPKVAEETRSVEDPKFVEDAPADITGSAVAANARAEPPDQADPGHAASRKRSVDSAGLAEAADGGRVRSKRIRNRETLDGAAVDGAAVETKSQNDWQLQELANADNYLFSAANFLLDKLEASNLGTPQDLHAIVKKEKAVNDTLVPAISDFYGFAQACTPDMASLLVNGIPGESIETLGAISREAGLSAFLGHNKTQSSRSSVKTPLGAIAGLEEWLETINSSFTYSKDAAWQFLVALLRPGSFPGSAPGSSSSYMTDLWPDDLKRTVVQIAVRFDEYVFPLIEEALSLKGNEDLRLRCAKQIHSQTPEDLSLIEMTQTLFELHLDVYSLIKRPGSNVDEVTKIQQKDRLERWSALANTAVNLRMNNSEDPRNDQLALRHIWATGFHISVCENVDQAYVLACMRDLKALLTSMDEPFLQLVNNAVIPEISMGAIEQELSKINMKDFFVKVFSDRDDDPISTIESLEPLLEWSDEAGVNRLTGNDDIEMQDVEEAEGSPSLHDPTPQEQVSQFLASSSWSLRLSLWQRLRQAYITIDYAPKIISCHLRSIELLMTEMRKPAYLDSSGEPRGLSLVRWLHLIDEFVRKVLKYERTTPNMYECVDSEHLKDSLNAVTSLLKLLHGFNLYEDQIRVGSIPSPAFEGRPKPSFVNTAKWVHNVQLRAWILFYSLIKEGIEQNPEAFEAPAEARFTFLRDLHYAVGMHRHICNAANKEMLHLLMEEFLQLSDVEGSELQLAQVLLDLYGLKCAWNPTDLIDHGCTDFEVINRNTAQKLLGFLMSQANKVAMKDLPRMELKTAIDRVHGCLSNRKNGDDIVLNRRVFSAYMKSTINPIDIFAAMKGTLELSSKFIAPSSAPIAAQGWYFLMGLIALSKFKSQKRLQSGGSTEDLNVAVAFFTQDLEYSSEHWETWYRLAQANEMHLEEHVAWSAEKLNNNSHEVFFYQRAAIHCYTMAVSCAVRIGDATSLESSKLAEMYSEFGNRIYSSSREPFSMAAFAFRDNEERHFSGDQMYKKEPHTALQLYTAWKLAAALFKRSLQLNPESWQNHFMLGKCLWKMFTASAEVRGRADPPQREEVIKAFTRAIQTLPSRRDSRKEPILEPHYKLLVIVHKMVMREDLKAAEGLKILKDGTSYTKKVPDPDPELKDEWMNYVTATLKALRHADKSAWHHRMTMRSAHLIYDDDPDNPVSAMEVRHELTQQMFTKTMVLQVWRPENERSGRHFVYTSRYVRFFVRVLVQLKDRENLEMLAKRLRRKLHEFFEHTKLWQETCQSYLKMLRRAGEIPEGHEDFVFKSLNHEEFTQRSTKLEMWCHNAENESTTRDILQEVIELKKLNNGLMKPTLIDDLLGDTYAKLYEETAAEIDKIELPKAEPSPAPASTPAAQHKPMALTSVMNMDGAADGPAGPFPISFNAPAPEQHVPKARAKGVGRRELQRRAEAAVKRPESVFGSNVGGTNMPIRGTSQAMPSTNQIVTVEIPASRASFDRGTVAGALGQGSGGMTADAGDGEGAGEDEEDGDGEGEGEGCAKDSAPASVHSDADDESELSELDDEDVEDPNAPEPPRVLFPNLQKSVERDAGGGERDRDRAQGGGSEVSGVTMGEEDEQPRA